MRFPTMWHVRPAGFKSACAYAQSDQSLCSSLEHSMSVKLLTKQHLEFLSESNFVKMPHSYVSRLINYIHSGCLVSGTPITVLC